MKKIDDDSTTNVEGKRFFDLINNEKEDEIIQFLNNNSSCEIWKYRDKEEDNSTILHSSIIKNSYSITKLLINHIKKYNEDNLKAFINERNNKGVTALHFASYKGNVPIIKLLISHGADETMITENKLNIFHYCAQGKKPNALIYFYLRYKGNDDEKKRELINLIKKTDKGGSTPLHWTAYCDSEDVMLYLLNLDIFENDREKQSFIDKKDNNGKTALHLSVQSKSIKIASKLLQNGATPDLRDNSNKTPYQLAIEKNQNSIAQKIKDNQGCQLCNIKAPVKKTKRSIKNILIAFFFQFISLSIMIISSVPFGSSLINSDNYIVNNILFLIYSVLLLAFLLLYIILLCSNPGEIPAQNISVLNGLIEQNKDLTKYCYKCYIKKNNDIKHCIICNKCYPNFDHHCYWINKCVTSNNYCAFMVFLFTTFFHLLYNFIISIFGIIAIIKDNKKNTQIIYLDYLKIIDYDYFADNYRWIHLGLNISLALIILLFLIPEAYLLLLHVRLYCSEYKTKRKNNSINIDPIESLLNMNE